MFVSRTHGRPVARGRVEARAEQRGADALALRRRVDADAGEVPVRPGRRLGAQRLDGAPVGEERAGRRAEAGTAS